jgi:hypothetical protein
VLFGKYRNNYALTFLKINNLNKDSFIGYRIMLTWTGVIASKLSSSFRTSRISLFKKSGHLLFGFDTLP